FLTALMLELLPGDPAVAIAGGDTFNLTDELIAQIREDLGLDQNIFARYGQWLGNALSGDLGTSYRTNQPVIDLILPRIPVTVQVMLLAQFLALAFALIFAPIAALYSGRSFDRGVSTVSFALVSVPTFISAIVLIQIFAVQLGVLPAIGYRPISDGIIPNLKSVALPAIALAAAEAGIYTRVLRSGLAASLDEDYIMMARAKGLSTRVVVMRHALRPASLPLLTLVGLSTGALIGGSVIIETIFGLPGLGRLVVDSINTRDIITVQALVAVIAVTYVIINYIVDIAYLVADPRIRYGKS
ncbi:MAG TPA: ABC transporter permease, partial [Acidimicrobiia bacterium]|nr:ABC transporter permease [Acidimicrobiia bacterium]